MTNVFAGRRNSRYPSKNRSLKLRAAVIEALEQRQMLSANLVISEFLASNQSGLTDAAGDHPDWIEIHNAGDATANLNDYFLTDNSGDPEKWRFPVQNLSAGAYLVVFADSTNTPPVANTELHTNFSLGASGEYLGLINAADDSVQFEYCADVSAADGGHFVRPAQRGRSQQRQDVFQRALAGRAEHAVGSAHELFGGGQDVYRHVAGDAVEHDAGRGRFITRPTARCRRQPRRPPIFYIRPAVADEHDDAADDRGGAGIPDQPGDEPIVHRTQCIDVDDQHAGLDQRIDVHLESADRFCQFVHRRDNDQRYRRRRLIGFDHQHGKRHGFALGSADYDGRAGFRIRGSSSESYPKKQYTLELWDENNDDKKVSLLGMPADSDWVLYAPYTEEIMMQNALAYQWANEMGHYASKTQYVEMFLNTTNTGTRGHAPALGGTASPTTGADFLGIYILEEKIKIDSNRVNVDEISATNPNGGFILNQDRYSGQSHFTSSVYGNNLDYDDPDADVTVSGVAQIKTAWNAFESALSSSSFSDPNSPNYYGNYIDVKSFVDYYLMEEMTRNVDAYWLSDYYTKAADTVVNGVVTQRGLISQSPVWDFNLSLGATNYNYASNSDGWNTATMLTPFPGAVGGPFTGPQAPYIYRLLQDPNFVQAVSDRWAQLRSGIFSTPQLMADMDANVAILSNGTTNYPVGPAPTQPPTNPLVRNFIRWPELGVAVTTDAHGRSERKLDHGRQPDQELADGARELDGFAVHPAAHRDSRRHVRRAGAGEHERQRGADDIGHGADQFELGITLPACRPGPRRAGICPALTHRPGQALRGFRPGATTPRRPARRSIICRQFRPG